MLQSCESMDLALTTRSLRSLFENLVTYKSGDRATQIHFILIKRDDLKMVKNCKVIPGEAVTAQHQLLLSHSDEKGAAGEESLKVRSEYGS